MAKENVTWTMWAIGGVVGLMLIVLPIMSSRIYANAADSRSEDIRLETKLTTQINKVDEKVERVESIVNDIRVLQGQHTMAQKTTNELLKVLAQRIPT